MDNHPVHRSHAVRDWAEQKAKRIRIVDLPTDSPELKPVEYLNNEVKANTQKRYRARDPKELETQLRTYLDEIGLGQKPHTLFRRRVVASQHHFQRHRPIQRRLAGFVHHAHATAAEFAVDAVPRQRR
jgi:hypothetical protein